jgi:hypothetical protein
VNDARCERNNVAIASLVALIPGAGRQQGLSWTYGGNILSAGSANT